MFNRKEESEFTYIVQLPKDQLHLDEFRQIALESKYSVNRNIAFMAFVKLILTTEKIYWDDSDLIDFCGDFSFQDMEQREIYIDTVEQLVSKVEKLWEYGSLTINQISFTVYTPVIIPFNFELEIQRDLYA